MNCVLWPGFNYEDIRMPGYMLDYREFIDNFHYFGLYKIIEKNVKYEYIGKIGIFIKDAEKYIYDFGTVKIYKQLQLF